MKFRNDGVPDLRGNGRGMMVGGALLMALASGACAAGGAAPAGEPIPDPAGAAAHAIESTAPDARRRITFGWTLDESGSRVRGRGVVRLDPPDRLRLDLFGPRNETVLAAALVGGEARLPAGAPADAPIPSPALLWAGLGAVRPPQGATLASASTADGETILRWVAAGGETYEYLLTPAADGPRLRRLQRLGSRGPLETVGVEWTEGGEISRATYRDWSAFRDLTLEIEESVAADPFPPGIWTP